MVIRHGELAQSGEINICDYGLLIDQGLLIIFGEYEVPIKMYFDIETGVEHLLLLLVFLFCE